MASRCLENEISTKGRRTPQSSRALVASAVVSTSLPSATARGEGVEASRAGRQREVLCNGMEAEAEMSWEASMHNRPDAGYCWSGMDPPSMSRRNHSCHVLVQMQSCIRSSTFWSLPAVRASRAGQVSRIGSSLGRASAWLRTFLTFPQARGMVFKAGWSRHRAKRIGRIKGFVAIFI